jgi:hypothetical protein
VLAKVLALHRLLHLRKVVWLAMRASKRCTRKLRCHAWIVMAGMPTVAPKTKHMCPAECRVVRMSA